ncbi:MAG: SpoIIE family protein phosphatase [Ignavibacteriales bacterium]|nr:SpoIIE family protein phosphatase [Ignavibacteriales bacterium]
MTQARESKLLDWGVSSITLPGQTESGDRHVVQHFQNGVLVGAIDGLGHGNEAAAAAIIAAEILQNFADESVISLIRRVHEELIPTRGVVMTLASIDLVENTMTWIGVGNVEGILFRADPHANPAQEVVLLRGGVVGYQLPQLYASVVQISQGDTLVFSTDGIKSGFYELIRTNHEAPGKTASRICSQYGKGTDDALVLVARYVGQKS